MVLELLHKGEGGGGGGGKKLWWEEENNNLGFGGGLTYSPTLNTAIAYVSTYM